MKILALQLKRIGDLVLTAPALRAMKAAGAEVTLVVSAGSAGALEMLVGHACDEALVYGARADAILPHVQHGNAGLWRRLARGGWDASIDFTGRDRSALMTLVAHAPQRIVARDALRDSGWRRWIYNAPIDSSVRERHTVDFYLDHLNGLNPRLPLENRAGPSLRLLPETVARTDRLLASAGLGQDEHFAVIHTGSARAEKYWVADRWAAVIRRLGRERGLRCVLTGGTGDPYEDAHLAQIRVALDGDARLCMDLAGKLDLPALAATLARAAFVLSVDTGPMHLAAAFERPQIALFGPTNPLHWRPRHPAAFVLQGGISDGPLTSFSSGTPRGRMEAISTGAVIDCIGLLTEKTTQDEC